MCEDSFLLRAKQTEAVMSKVKKEEIISRLTESQRRVWNGRVSRLQRGGLESCGLSKCFSMLLWHGTTDANADNICKGGFAARIRSTDSGYFGGPAVYLTPQAEYAEKYATGEFTNDAGACAPDAICMLLCWVVVGGVYVITREGDYPLGACTSRFYCVGDTSKEKFQPGYDAHFVTVDKAMKFQAAEVIDGGGMEGRLFDEVVVREETQVLPAFKVMFRRTY